MNTEEQARYDRQVRLWGKATQKLLLRTEVRVRGVASTCAEVVKNLVLAGVRSVCLLDESALHETEMKYNFLVQACDTSQTRSGASARRLQSLNSHVSVTSMSSRQVDSMTEQRTAPFIVCIAHITSIEDAYAELRFPWCASSDLVILVADMGKLSVCFLLSKARKVAYENQLDGLFCAHVSRRSQMFQRTFLSLKMMKYSGTFFERLAMVSQIATENHLPMPTDSDLEQILAASSPDSSSTAVKATMAGGVIAQLIVNEIGRKGSEVSVDESYAWALCETDHSHSNVQVGFLSAN